MTKNKGGKDAKVYYMAVLSGGDFHPNDSLCYDTLQEAYDSIIPDADPEADQVWEIHKCEIVSVSKVKIREQGKTVTTLDGKKTLSKEDLK